MDVCVMKGQRKSEKKERRQGEMQKVNRKTMNKERLKR